MKVRLVAITEPDLANTGCSSAEEFIAYAARVSNPGNQMNNETAPKLLKYLVKNHHWSPFEMAHAVMEIETTRDIARQILRHRSFSFQEFSQRYADGTQLGFEIAEARLQDLKNRQNSIEVEDEELQNSWGRRQYDIVHQANATYKWAIENGIAKEQARKVLPEGLTGSRLYMSGTIRSWIHYCAERTKLGVQKEHRDIAKQVLAILTDRFPSITEIISDNQ